MKRLEGRPLSFNMDIKPLVQRAETWYDFINSSSDEDPVCMRLLILLIRQYFI